jgi:hypothetical protein
MMRLSKYRAKGYTLPTSEMVRMSLTLMQSRLPTSWDELEAVIGGTYGQQVKLHTDGKEFSVQAAIDLFDDLNVDLLYPDTSTDYSGFSADDFEMAFTDEKVYKFTRPEKDSWFSSIGPREALMSTDGRVIVDSGNAIKLRDMLKRESFETAPSDMMVYGYKTLNELPDGTLENSVNRKKIKYAVGEWTEEPVSPHIFVHTKSSHSHGAGNTKKYKVGFLLSDVVTMNGTETTVKKLKVLEKVA